MKETIKKYFEGLAKLDAVIAEAYQEEKLDGCIQYIKSKAAKHLNNQNGFIDDGIVFKWCRDYMLGDVPHEELDAIKEPAEETRTCKDCGYFDEETSNCLFDGSPKNPDMTICTDFIVHAKTEPKKEKKTEKKDLKKTQEYDGPWLFDFDEGGENA